MPLGPALTSAVVDPSVLGSSVILIRRSVFEAVGGYRELRGAAHEDWELQVKLTSAGYRTDVVPEYLYYYRQTGNSLSRNVDPVRAKRRVIEQFDKQLATVGLHGAGSANARLVLIGWTNSFGSATSGSTPLGSCRFRTTNPCEWPHLRCPSC